MSSSNEDLLSSSEVLLKIMDSVYDTLIAIDEQGIIRLFNKSGERCFGYSAKEVEGKHVNILMPEEAYDKHDLTIVDYINQKTKPVIGVTSRELIAQHKDGHRIPIDIVINEMRISDQRFFVGIIRDLSQRKNIELMLYELSHFDTLTGLYNRTFLNEYMEKSIARSTRGEHELILMVIGIDRFRVINESLGTEQADMLLKQIAARLKANLRSGDLLARVAGAKFAVVMEPIKDPASMAARVAFFQNLLAEPYELSDTEASITSSVGISIAPRDGETSSTLLDNAFYALNSSRREGLGRSHFYSPELNNRSIHRVSQESKLRRALEGDEFTLYYQPKVDLETGRMSGVEALIRWQEPESNTLISPMEFIPMLEETGLIIQVGEWVFNRVCSDIQRWQERGHEIKVAVNISPVQFKDKGLADMIRQVIQENRVDPHLIECELTESALLDNNQANIAKLNQMKEIGVDISIDDFGTGYSSLSYLSSLPIDTLKIDRAFVSRATTDPRSAAIVKTVIQLAHNLRLKVVAEGAEKEDQVGFLQKHQCDQVQGYVFSKPLPADNLLAFKTESLNSFQHMFNKRKNQTLLIVDDEKNIVDLLVSLFEDEGYKVIGTTLIEEAFAALSSHDIGVILCDQRMPKMKGSEFFNATKGIYPDTQRIILTGFSDMEDIVSAINQGSIYKFVKKPWEPESLKNIVRNAFRIYDLLVQDRLNRSSRRLFA